VLTHYEASVSACAALHYHDVISFVVSLLQKNSEGTTQPISNQWKSVEMLVLLALCILYHVSDVSHKIQVHDV